MKKIILLAVLAAFMAGCAEKNMPSIVTDWQSFSPEKKCIFVLDWYTGAFRAHEARVKAIKPKTVVSAAEWEKQAKRIELINKEAAILDKARPYVALFEMWQIGGPAPGDGASAAINAAMIALGQLALEVE